MIYLDFIPEEAQEIINKHFKVGYFTKGYNYMPLEYQLGLFLKLKHFARESWLSGKKIKFDDRRKDLMYYEAIIKICFILGKCNESKWINKNTVFPNTCFRSGFISISFYKRKDELLDFLSWVANRFLCFECLW